MTHAIMSFVVLAVSAIGADPWTAPADVKARLCPQPKELSLDPRGEPADLMQGARVVPLPGADVWVVNAADRLWSELVKKPRPAVSAGPRVTITVGALPDWRQAGKENAFPSERLDSLAGGPAEAYLMEVKGKEIRICGLDPRGTVHGVETLIQLIRLEQRLPALFIHDYPDTTLRVSYVGGGDKLDDRARRIIDLAVQYKLNTLVFENAAYYLLDDPGKLADAKSVFDYCRARGIEPVPELQSFGWSQCVLPMDPLCVEAVRWSNRRFQFGKDGIAVPIQGDAGTSLPLRNGGLDEVQGNVFVGWGQDDAGNAIFAEPDGKGGKCLRITRTKAGHLRVWQKVACNPDTHYDLEADVKTEAGGTDFKAYFEVYGDKGLFAALPQISETTGWKRHRLAFKSGSSTELTIYLRAQEGTGAAWFDNVSCKVARPMALVNLVVTPDSPITVTNLDGTTLYEEGADYAVIPGDLRFEGEGPSTFPPTNKPWQIRRKPGGRIVEGELVLVSYDWAEPGDITYCPSEPRTHAIMQKAIADTIRTLRPRYIHLGHDEPRVINRDSRCKKRNLKAYEIFVEDVKRMREYVRSADPDCRMMIWADTLRLAPDGNVQIAWHTKETCRLQDITRNMPKDILLGVWEYSGHEYQPIHDSMAVLIEEGFDVTGSPWYDLVNTYRWAQAVRALRRRGPRCQGMFLTTWDGRWDALPLCADLMWNLPEPGEEDAAALERKLKARYGGFATCP